MWHGFPGLGVLRRLRPAQALQPATGLSPGNSTGCAALGEWNLSGSRVHCLFDRRVRHPALPLWHRHGYAVGLHYGLRTQECEPGPKFPAVKGGCAPQPSPNPPDLELVQISRGVRHRFLAYTFPSCSPGPTHLAVLGRPDFVAAAPTLPRRSPRPGCRQLPPAATTAGR